MEEKESGLLAKILSEDELHKIPDNVQNKVEKYFEERFEDFMRSKALGEASKNCLDEVRGNFEKQVSDLTSRIQDYEAKLEASQQNVNELREQLDSSRLEVNRLVESVKKYESEAIECRREKNNAIDERDSLIKMVERREAELERIQSDLKTYESQLQSAINAKCEAIANTDEVKSREISLDYKEKRLEQEKAILTNQISSLSEDLNRNIAELQTIRRDNTMKNLELQTKLTEKTEELKIANSSIEHLNETINSLTVKCEDLAAKMFAQSDSTTKMMEHYKKELQAKEKLADLYKNTSDDNVNQTNELAAGVGELKRLLNEASDQYGELETKNKAMQVKHEQELDEKESLIHSLKDELKHANDLLKTAKEDNLEIAIEKLAPTAAVTMRLIKSDMSLTELYSMYVKTTEELQLQKKEKGRLQLQLNDILQELEAKAPVVSKLQMEHQKLVEANNELSQQLENIITERVEVRDELQDSIAKINHMQRENRNLKVSQNDLSRQVCYLLKEVEQARGGFASENEQSISSDMSANEVISKKLVTFNDIAELQETNQKLLLLVRDLSSKLEEVEEAKSSMDQASYEAKIATYSKRLQEMQESQGYQSQMLSISMQKCERYKKLYYDAMRSSGKNMSQVIDGSLNEQMDVADDENVQSTANNSAVSSEVVASKDKRIGELEDRIKELHDQIKTTKEEHEEYRREKLTNDKLMNEQFDKMRTELRELTSANCKLMSTVEYNNEQIKIQQKNVATYKKQISTLEERNRNYENTIVKHEQTIMYLKDETMNAQRKLASAEVQLDNLKQECRLLRDTESRLHVERESLLRERQSQNLLLNNLEMIKVSFERSETEGRQRLEVRLDESNRECSALRRRLQEEQDRFRELAADLKRQTDTAKARMEEEQQIAQKLQQDSVNLREELATKTNQIEDLSQKLQESLTPHKNDNPIAQANKRARECELKYAEAALEIESLKKEVEATREHAQQYCKMSQSSEQELKELYDQYSQYKLKTEEELKKLRSLEITLKSRIDELDTEIQLQITGAQLSTGSSSDQIQKVQIELKEALQKLSENNREMRDLREQCNNLTSSLQSVEQKYANEMMLHSADIQELSRLKEEVHRVREDSAELKAARDKATIVLEEAKKGYADSDEQLKKEKDELERRLVDLDAQNATLHDQIQALSSKLAMSSHTDESMNESHPHDSSLNVSSSNKSLLEDESKNNDQLLQIIKYLRKEKDIAVAKVDILKSENVRILSEQNILQKRLTESNQSLNNERTKSEVVIVTATKHEEILRKVETLNAMTDSNRILREERDALAARVKDMSERLTKVEDELFPLQEKIREQTTKGEELQAENTSLRTEAVRWRQRANALVERSNKNPEEFKRIQNERESLAKMLTAEKEALKQAHDELNSIKVDKTRMEAEIANLSRQIQTMTDDKKKTVDEFNTLKQQNSRLTHEIMELKNQLLHKEEELKKIGEDLTSKDSSLTDLKNKEFQIRKIAKRYKDSYFELKNQMEGKQTSGNAEGDAANLGEGTSIVKQETEKELKEKVNELNAQIKQSQEDLEKFRKENENYKQVIEMEEHNKTLLKEAKTRIINLTETKNAVSRELAAAKAQLQSVEQNRDDNDMLIKSQYEARIARLEQEQLNHDKDSKETVARLTRENENLMLRINQLQRQLGLQVSKPSTSSSSSSEKGSADPPRTANVKPMSGPSGQQSATVTPWRGSETPLASIRPMSVQNSRTAAVLPTSQTSNVAAVQGSSSSGSVTALVPPQQQVHTTGNSPGEAMSSSPTSSHTDYMPATSSAAVVVAAIPPMGANAAESSQEAESVPSQNNESTSSSSSQMLVSGGQQQQAVALVSPRVEGTSQNLVPPQSAQIQETNQPSTSGTSSSSNISVSSHHQASSSNTVTTTQAGGHKRPRDVEGDSSTSNEELPDKTPTLTKRQRMQAGEAAAYQGVSESGLDVEYQVPTSSQRDQEDDIIIVDSEEDDGMADEGNADVDDGPMEDEADNGEGYEMEESYEQEPDIDEGEGPDIDEDNMQSDNNEVEVDDSSEVPNQSGTSSSTNHVAPDASTSQVVEQSSADQPSEGQNPSDSQQIPSISSGSEAAGSSSQSTSNLRQVAPLTRQQQATLLMLQQGFEETGDDSIVPSTPTLYVPRRADGFSEAVSSPHPQVPHAARFTFSESTSSTATATTSRPGVVAGEGIDDTRVDLSEEASGRSSVSVQESSESSATVAEGTSSTEKIEPAASNIPEAGPSRSEDVSAEAGGSTTEDAESAVDGASTSDVHEGEPGHLEDGDIEDEEGMDGVTSEGEKASAGTEEPAEIEEGREAEASTSPTINTRSRTVRGTPQNRRNNNRNHHQRGGRPTPIIWQDQNRGGRHMNQGGPMRGPGGEQSSPQRGGFQNQQNRGQRARRMRRPSFGNRENNREMRDLREQCNNLTSSLQSVEQKYANEMMLHSADIQELSRLKEEVHRVREDSAELKAARDKATIVLEEAKKGYADSDEQLKKEKDELERRLVDLDAQNATLHDQIQALSSKLAMSSHTDESMNESHPHDSSLNVSSSNKSLLEDESKNNDQLLQIIKYLRKEKDIAVAKVDILKSENVRILSEQNILQKRLTESNQSLNNERTKSEVVIVTATKHEEILRKVETLNAMTDSNRILREERDALAARVKDMSERLTKVEDELFPLQEKIREQTTKGEELQAENTSLRTEAVRWRQRANALVERSNKNPEEFKRIQNERESLAKMLTAEKEALKQAHDELNSIKVDKTRMEAEIANLSRQIQTMTDDKKKTVDEFNTLKQQNSRLTHEIMELKNQLLHKEEELKKIGEDLTSKDSSLTDLKNKEFQIRKIAKRYKDSYFELKNQMEGKQTSGNAEGDAANLGEGTSIVKQETEKELKEKVNELNAQIKQSQEDLEKFRKENENYKQVIEMEEHNKTLLKEAKTRIINLTETKNAVSRELAAAKAQLQSVEQNRDDNDMLIKSQYEARIARLEQEQLNHDKDSKETVARLTRENENLMLRINQLQRQLGLQVSKPSTSSSSSSEKGSADPPRTANVKPMSGPSGQQSATVTPWRGSETPLASIRPMSVQNSRTAAVLPTSQTSNVAAVQGSSSSGSVTALVPPQQQVHTTGNSPGEAMSSSPTSSHTDYMPATSSAAVVVAAIPPMGANAAESSQEAESVPSQNNESTSSSSSQMLVSGGQQQQAVALVSPRVEGTSQNLVPPQSAQIQETNQPSTSGTSSSSNISVSSHHQASSSNTVTTTQAGGHKRPRDVEGDSSTSNEELPDKTPTLTKRQRMQAGEAAAYQGVSESGLDVEYQVPTSSQRDQEDDIIIVDSEEDDGMADEGNADVDDGPMEDEADNGEGYEMEESYEQEPDIDEGEGPDIDEDNMQSDNNEVEVDDSSEVPNQSGTSSSTNHVAPDASTSQVVEQSSADQPSEGQNPSDSQQIPSISSGSEAAGSSSQSTSNLRQVAPLTRQQQATLLMLQQGFEETGDDSIVPSTPTLYVPRRADGFSEAVSSPHPQVPHAARFTFSESTSSTATATTSRPGVVAGEGIDDTRVDLSEEASGRSSVSVQESSESSATVAEGTSSTEKIEPAASNIPEAGPSRSEDVSAEAGGSTTEDAESAVDGASTSDVHEGEPGHLEDGDIEDEEGMDGVTSEGEKASAGTEEPAEIEEGREAEASTSPTINTRSRTVRGTPQNRRNNNRNHHQRGGRPTPIIWQDQNRGGRHMNQGGPMRGPGGEQSSPQRGGFQNQQNRGQRARRMRRPSFGNRY